MPVIKRTTFYKEGYCGFVQFCCCCFGFGFFFCCLFVCLFVFEVVRGHGSDGVRLLSSVGKRQFDCKVWQVI